MVDMPTQVAGGFVPTQADQAGVRDWFDRYDELAATAQVERIAEMAMFPLNMVTDDGDGNGSASQCSRERFVRDMTEVMGEGARMESTRTPHFLSAALVFVVTEAVLTAEGDTVHLRYGDLLVKHGGQWRFQTMVQGGWG